jgi:hypothetical protein
MIKVHIVRNKAGLIKKIEIKGHAGYAKKGSDIVCAAASVTAYTAAGALGDLAGIENCYTEKDGYMRIEVPGVMEEAQRRTAEIILKTAAIGFKQLEGEYSEYISVLDEEVLNCD